MLQFLTYLLHNQIIEMRRSQNLCCPFSVPSRRLASLLDAMEMSVNLHDGSELQLSVSIKPKLRLAGRGQTPELYPTSEKRFNKRYIFQWNYLQKTCSFIVWNSLFIYLFLGFISKIEHYLVWKTSAQVKFRNLKISWSSDWLPTWGAISLKNYEKVKCEFKNILALLFHSSTARIVYLIVAKP